MSGKKVKAAPISRRVIGPPISSTIDVKPFAVNEQDSEEIEQPRAKSQPKIKKLSGRPKKNPNDKVQPVNLTLHRKLNEEIDDFLNSLNKLSPVDIPKSQFVSFAIRELINSSPEEVFRRFVESRNKSRNS